jgi:predicted lipoprotein
MKKLSIFIAALLTIAACSSNDMNEDSTEGNNYDRTLLLTNWADNIIIPSYSNYQSKLVTLEANITTFNAAATETNLEALRVSWVDAYKAYQYVAIYSFGKSEEIYLKETANTYPTNNSGIEANLISGNYNLALLSQFDKQGFPAMDYLINGLGTTDSQILTYYTTKENGLKYKKYLADLGTRLKSSADLVLADWNSGYRTSYIAKNGTSVSSSVSITINNFVKNLEKNVRTGKLGIPAGVFSSGIKYKEKVEAFYKDDLSKELLNTSIKASQDFFNGKHVNNATEGEGLKSYLDYLKIVRGGKQLSAIINDQFSTIFTVNNALSASLSNQVSTDNDKMILAYDALQKNVVNTKLDMMQALNITVDYVDSDGD